MAHREIGMWETLEVLRRVAGLDVYKDSFEFERISRDLEERGKEFHGPKPWVKRFSPAGAAPNGVGTRPVRGQSGRRRAARRWSPEDGWTAVTRNLFAALELRECVRASLREEIFG